MYMVCFITFHDFRLAIDTEKFKEFKIINQNCYHAMNDNSFWLVIVCVKK